MRHKQPDTFDTYTTETTADRGLYYTAETKISHFDIMDKFVQKTELSLVQEIITERTNGIQSQITDIKDSLSGRETRFWIVNGLIISAITAIFLYVLPELYKKDYKEKYDALAESIIKLSSKVEKLQQGLQSEKGRKIEHK